MSVMSAYVNVDNFPGIGDIGVKVQKPAYLDYTTRITSK